MTTAATTTPRKRDRPRNEKEEARKRRFVESLKTAPREVVRAAIERGKIKCVDQTIRLNNVKRLLAHRCTIYGDGNHVLGNDNTIIGADNTAEGDGNRIILPSERSAGSTLAGAIVEAVDEASTAATTTPPAQPIPVPARPLPPAVEAPPARRFVKLPSKWCVLNGVVLYEPSEYTALFSWHNDNVRFNGARVPMSRSLTVAPEIMMNMPETMMRIIGLRNIPFRSNVEQAGRVFADALAHNRVELPPGAPVPPGMELVDVVNPPSSTVMMSSSTSSATSAPRPAFLPELGVNPDASVWKCSLLDLPGSASVAAEGAPSCKVCLVNEPDVMFEPCHHLMCCRECAKELYKSQPDNPMCPVCRKTIRFASIVYVGS